jgi:hypothetical protein
MIPNTQTAPNRLCSLTSEKNMFNIFTAHSTNWTGAQVTNMFISQNTFAWNETP